MNPFRIRIQCRGNDQGEKWCAQLIKSDDRNHDVLVAAVNELAHPVAARQAGEFLLLGALNGWLPNTPSREDVGAGITALNAPAEELVAEVDGADIDLARVTAIVDEVWLACARRVRAEATSD